MHFITNRRFNEGNGALRDDAGNLLLDAQGRVQFEERKVTFDLEDTDPTAAVFFCQRKGPDNYREIGSQKFFKALRTPPPKGAKQILLYIHGFNNLPEGDIFDRALRLQKFFDKKSKGLIEVVPMIWPCDNDMGILKDYWDDQDAAEKSAVSFSRVVGKFMDWRDEMAPNRENDRDRYCLKRINVLAHSMGNRVLRYTLKKWVHDFGAAPSIFRNIFMAAADVVNETLEPNQAGHYISDAARNVVVYYANDDLALRSSKVVNLKNKVVSKRLGHSGPEDMNKVSRNVYAIDCDNFNNTYDKPKGHAYFIEDGNGKPGSVFLHILHSLQTGRVHANADRMLELPKSGYKPPARSGEE